MGGGATVETNVDMGGGATVETTVDMGGGMEVMLGGRDGPCTVELVPAWPKENWPSRATKLELRICRRLYSKRSPAVALDPAGAPESLWLRRRTRRAGLGWGKIQSWLASFSLSTGSAYIVLNYN
ncbi:hypothetical protein GUJ93_ZPchr0001g30605 [Zizania palustris]|uniref:Uncharacterized protein n=1 Tax=Zizania palustris TaxID=103762 RepID=A0A8J5RRJ4_ZIZPA|nr:hypothetical protein GUJ93_ZPchr0001g30605 [Zizania palustris]